MMWPTYGVFWLTLGYLDPGTGSFLLQLLIAGALGALFTVKQFWRQLSALLPGGSKRGAVDDDAAGPQGVDRP